MHAEDLPILSYLVQVASGGEKRLDAVRLRAAVEPLLDGAGFVRNGQAREDFVRIVETMVDRREGWQPTAGAPLVSPLPATFLPGGCPVNIDVTFKSEDPRLARIEEMLGQVLSTQQLLLQRSADMSESLNRLTQEVAQTRGVVDSAVTLISGIAAQIRDSIGDNAALEALADDLDNQQAKLAQAISEFPTNPGTGTGSTGGGDTIDTDGTGSTTEPAVEPTPVTGDTGTATDADGDTVSTPEDGDSTRFDDSGTPGTASL